MTELPGFATPDAPERVSGAYRRIGEYLVVSPLGDDAVGSVYRALHTEDGRFVRLRVLQSPELSPSRVLATAELKDDSVARLTTRSARGELQISEGTPYLVWPERQGWTLDFVLARARAGGWGMPIEFALLLAERATAQMDRARLVGGCHGALWPGFVSVSSDAEVFVGGFGLAPAILPELSKPRMWRDVAPYVAPEIRAGAAPCQSGDVYSIGVLLTELLTGQRASADTPPPRWRADDDFSQEVSLLLRFALSQRSERFATLRELHASLEELIAACPFETSPADLALFLYDLLNPDSRILPSSFDGTSTNPLASARFRVVSTPSDGTPTAAPGSPSLASTDISPTADPGGARILPMTAARERPVSLLRWISRAAAVAAAIVGLFLLDRPIRWTPSARHRAPASGVAPLQPSLALMASPGVIWRASALSKSPSSTDAAPSPRRGAPQSASAKHKSELMAQAETLRLKAALARIEAEQLEASVHAAKTFLQATTEEQGAAECLRRRQYGAACDAYARALDLFTQARSQSREERVRQIQIAGEVSGR